MCSGLARAGACDEAQATVAVPPGHGAASRHRYPAGVIRIGAALLPRIAAASAAEVAELTESPNPVVRMLLAARHDLPNGIRGALATDPDAKVVQSVAPHPDVAETPLRAIVARHGVRVAAKAATTRTPAPTLLEELTRHDPPVRDVFRDVAWHHNATAPALLACLADRQARPIAAGHPALPPAFITELLIDNDWQVVEAAAGNPSLPPRP
ncbi:hypothetical protein [Streptomyces sp. NPDC003710]